LFPWKKRKPTGEMGERKGGERVREWELTKRGINGQRRMGRQTESDRKREGERTEAWKREGEMAKEQ
jgi:hypothetical protein